MHSPFVVALALSAAACSTQQDHTIDRVHDACRPLALVAPGATGIQTTGMLETIALWRDVGITSLELDEGANTIEVRFEPASPAFRGLYDDETGIIYINSELTDPSVVGIVLAHELGHVFGLDHVDDRESLMNRGNISTPPNAADGDAVADRWGRCE